MSPSYTQYSWEVSPYSAKTRAAFRYKGVPFREVPPTIVGMMQTIPKKVGKTIMPVVITPQGEWVQDSSDIIDLLEARHPSRPVYPAGPVQKLAALLLELFGDEWLINAALHYRWQYPDMQSVNARFAIAEFGRNALPGVPAALQRKAGAKVAAQMSGYMPKLGIDRTTAPGIEETMEVTLDAIDAALEERPYLLGQHPTIADFALYATPYAHVYRDPGSTAVVAQRPRVVQWIERLRAPAPLYGPLDADDAVPAALDPIFVRLFEDQWPFVADTRAAFDEYLREHAGTSKVPRSMGPGPVRFAGREATRARIVFTLWMARRVVDHLLSLEGEERAAADAFLERVGGEALRDVTEWPKLVRRNYRLALEREG